MPWPGPVPPRSRLWQVPVLAAAGNRGQGESGEGGHFRRGDRAGEDPREHRGGVGQMVAGTPAEWGFGEVSEVGKHGNGKYM